MKITVFGLTLSSAWGNGHATPYRAILRALHRLGHELTFYERDVEYYARRRDFTACDYCKLVLYPSWDEVRKWALAEAAASDVVMTGSYLPEGARINQEVLGLSQPVRLFYDLDTPITLAQLTPRPASSAPGEPPSFAGCGQPPTTSNFIPSNAAVAVAGNSAAVEYLRADQIPEFDVYLSFTGGPILRELEERWGARRAHALYGCVDPDVHMPVPPRPNWRCDLSYMGTYAADRQHKLEQLFLEPARRMTTHRFVLAGSLYPHTDWGTNILRLEHVPPTDHPALYCSSRAALNITRAGMAAAGGFCPSGRFFEAAACETPILSDWFEGLDTFFAPGEEIFVVRTADDVIAALRCPARELQRLARRAHQRTLEEHTGMNRARQLLDILQEAKWTRTAEPSPEKTRLVGSR